MYLTSYNPFSNIVRNLWGIPTLAPLGEEMGKRFTPSVDVVENKNQWLFHFDVPGTKREDIHISIDADQLVVTGERREDTKKEEAGYAYTERVHGQFERRFSLPENSDKDNITAAMDEGVLTVSVNKLPDIQPRQIPVNKK